LAKIPKFEVVSLTPLEAGALKAYATVRVASLLTISEIRLIQNGQQAPWCSLPQKSWVDDGGKRRYSTLVEFHEKAWREALTAAVVEAWQDFPQGIRPVETIQQRPASFGEAVREKAGLGQSGGHS